MIGDSSPYYGIVHFDKNGERIPKVLLYSEKIKNKEKCNEIELMYANPQAYLRGVFIYVDENTRRQDIICNWGKIKDKRNKYYQKIGNELNDENSEGVRFLQWMKYLELNMRELIIFLNFEAIVLFVQYFRAKDEEWKEIGLKRLKTLFKALNLEKEFERRLVYAQKRIKEGLAPWNIENLPFNETSLKYKVETIEKKIAIGKINLGERGGSDAYAWHSLHYSLKCIGYYDKNVDFIGQAEALHDRKFSDIWKNHGTWITDLMKEASRVSRIEWDKWADISPATKEFIAERKRMFRNE